MRKITLLILAALLSFGVWAQLDESVKDNLNKLER
jgi:hypothetical protein